MIFFSFWLNIYDCQVIWIICGSCFSEFPLSSECLSGGGFIQSHLRRCEIFNIYFMLLWPLNTLPCFPITFLYPCFFTTVSKWTLTLATYPLSVNFIVEKHMWDTSSSRWVFFHHNLISECLVSSIQLGDLENNLQSLVIFSTQGQHHIPLLSATSDKL